MKNLYRLVLILCLGTVYVCSSVSYDGYKVFELIPKTAEQLELLTKYDGVKNFDFWVHPRSLNQPSNLMVPPESVSDLEGVLKQHGFEYRILIDNVQETIEEEDARQRIAQLSTRSQSLGDVTFTHYMHHHEINSYLRKVAANYPDIVTLVDFGTTYEGREMLLVQISTNNGTIGTNNKPIIFIDAAIHAREWIAPPTALYIINQLVENPENRDMFENVDWAIIPVLNPDGYEFTQTGDRMWRKTRKSPNVTDCYGVDGNRNFDYYWMLAGASDNECSQTFAGPEPFSEVETQALRDYLNIYKDNIKLYLTIHSYGSMLLYPWGWTSDLPDDEPELRYLAELVNARISAVNGTQYTIGTSTNVLYVAAGGSDDYAKGVLGIELSYTIELPGGGNQGFNPPANRIQSIVEETFEGFKAYQGYIEEKYVTNATDTHKLVNNIAYSFT